MLPGVRRAIADVDPAVVIGSSGTIDEFIASAVAQPRFRTVVLLALALLAAAFAGVGLYSVVAYAVAQRTAEIGIRMALGADQRAVIVLILWDGARIGVAGIGSGVVVAFAMARAMASLLYGIAPTDALSFAAPAVSLAAVMLVASYLPARRAAGVDPIAALRAE